MNAGVLTFETVFTEGVGTGTALLSSSPTSNTNRFVAASTDDSLTTNHLESETTDNNSTATQINPADEQTPSFSEALRKETVRRTDQQGQDKTEPETEDPSSEAVPGAVAAQLASTQKPAIATAALGEENAVKTDSLGQLEAGAKTPNKPAELVASLQTHKQLSVSAQAPSPTGIKSAELTSENPNTENGLLLTADQGQLGLKTVSRGSSADTLTAGPQSQEGENGGKIPASNETFIVTEYLTNQQSGKE